MNQLSLELLSTILEFAPCPDDKRVHYSVTTLKNLPTPEPTYSTDSHSQPSYRSIRTNHKSNVTLTLRQSPRPGDDWSELAPPTPHPRQSETHCNLDPTSRIARPLRFGIPLIVSFKLIVPPYEVSPRMVNTRPGIPNLHFHTIPQDRMVPPTCHVFPLMFLNSSAFSKLCLISKSLTIEGRDATLFNDLRELADRLDNARHPLGRLVEYLWDCDISPHSGLQNLFSPPDGSSPH